MPDSPPAAPFTPFVPDWFDVPRRLETPRFVLVPLGAEHNERDYEAWTTSMEHIHATPGFETHRWPHPMTLEENLGDLVRHEEDFAQRQGFTYTVLSRAPGTEPTEIVGCLYIYPGDPHTGGRETVDARVRSWTRASHAALDVEVWRAVNTWLAETWPFRHVSYAPRPG